MNISDYRTITYFDVETTSLNPELGEIIQICIVTEDRDGNLEEWSTKIRPRLAQGTYQKSALRINNFVPKEWIDAPKFEEVADEITANTATNASTCRRYTTATRSHRGWSSAPSAVANRVCPGGRASKSAQGGFFTRRHSCPGFELTYGQECHANRTLVIKFTYIDLP